jgi:hypothetical protein
MWRAILSFVGGVLSLAIMIIATTRSGDAARNVLSYLPVIPPLPTWVRPVVIAISVMVASICFPAAIILLFRKSSERIAPKDLMSRYYDGEF